MSRHEREATGGPVDTFRRRNCGSARFVLVGEPFHGAEGPYGLDGLRFACRLGRLGPHPHQLEKPLAGERALEPVQELRGRIDLVVVLTVGEDGELVEIFVEPRCGLGDAGELTLMRRSSLQRRSVDRADSGRSGLVGGN